MKDNEYLKISIIKHNEMTDEQKQMTEDAETLALHLYEQIIACKINRTAEVSINAIPILNALLVASISDCNIELAAILLEAISKTSSNKFKELIRVKESKEKNED